MSLKAICTNYIKVLYTLLPKSLYTPYKNGHKHFSQYLFYLVQKGQSIWQLKLPHSKDHAKTIYQQCVVPYHNYYAAHSTNFSANQWKDWNKNL